MPMYAGLKLHALTRHRILVDSLFSIGLSVSYDRVLDIVSAMGRHICKYYREIGVVCPPQLRKGLFVTTDIDNIDHNPSSATSVGALHATSLSMFQNIFTRTPPNENFSPECLSNNSSEDLKLPLSYTEIVPQDIRTSKVYPPPISESVTSKMGMQCDVMKPWNPEFEWFDFVEKHWMENITSDSKLS